MRCERCREALSARLDDEDPGIDDASVHAHLASCASCRAYESRLVDLHRMTRVRRAEPVPDLSGAVMARMPVPGNPHDAVLGWLRSGLTFIGVVTVLLAAAVIAANDPTNPAHLAAWDLAFGGALLIAAYQPARARGLLPMAVLLVGSMALASTVDLANGHDPTHGLLFHAAELIGVLFLALMARHQRPWRTPRELSAA
jgi:predicted anti-sigma-YlaC factor YlaD